MHDNILGQAPINQLYDDSISFACGDIIMSDCNGSLKMKHLAVWGKLGWITIKQPHLGMCFFYFSYIN